VLVKCWRLQGVQYFVDVHIFVRGSGKDDEPDLLAEVEDGLEKVIEVYTTELIPNAHCTLNSIVPSTTENADDLQNLWHSIAAVQVNFWKAKGV
jgi:hypothetical protein